METYTCSQKSCTKQVSKKSSMNCTVCTMVLKAQHKRALANQRLLQHIDSSRVFSGSMKLFS